MHEHSRDSDKHRIPGGEPAESAARSRSARRRRRRHDRRVAALFVRRIVTRDPGVAGDPIRLKFARGLNDFRAAWRDCPAAACRRVKACRDRALPCARLVPPPRDQDEESAAAAEIYRMLQNHQAAGEGEEAGGPSSSPLPGGEGKKRAGPKIFSALSPAGRGRC